jgi:hypothetical protein
MVNFQRNPFFTGQESSLTRLAEMVSSNKRCNRAALVGLGGIGKTQVALEYVYRLRECRPDCSVFWIQATNSESIQEGFFDICKHFKYQISIRGNRNLES